MHAPRLHYCHSDARGEAAKAWSGCEGVCHNDNGTDDGEAHCWACRASWGASGRSAAPSSEPW